MNHSILPAFIRWGGSFYHVQVSVADGVVSVQVDPKNAELEQTVRESVEQDRLKQLAVYKGFGFDYLTCDPRRGE